MQGLGGGLCLFASCILWSASAAAQLVTPPASPHPLVNVTDAKVVVLLEPVAGAKLTSATVRRVAAGDAQQPTLLGAFTPTLGDGGITLAVNTKLVVLPRSYTVSIGLKGTVRNAAADIDPKPEANPGPKPEANPGPKPEANPDPEDDAETEVAAQALDVVVVLPPAKLAPIPSISQTLERWPWDGPGPEVRLKLRETSQLTSISNLYVDQVGVAVNGERQVSADFAPRKPPTVLAAGSRELLTLDGKGFEVGTTKGTLSISGDQLEPSVEVPFEVKTRVFDWLMMPWFLLFGVLGWVVRHQLQNAAVRAELRVELDRLRSEVEEEVTTNSDPQKLEKLLADALDVVKGSDNAKLKAALEALGNGLAAARTAKAQVLTQQLEVISTREQTLATRFDLPAQLDLTRAREHLAGAAQAVRTDNALRARDELKAFDDAIVILAGSVDQWRNSLSPALKPLQKDADVGIKVVLPSAVQAQAQQLLERLDQALETAAYDVITPPPLDGYLRAVHAANLAARNLANALFTSFKQAAEAVDNVLKEAERPPALAGIVAALPAPAQDVGELDFGRLVDAFRRVFKTVRSLLQHAEAKALAGEGKFAEAVAKDEALSGRSSTLTQVAAVLSRPAAVATPAPEPVIPEVPAGRPRVVLATFGPRAHERQRALAELKTLQVVRGVVAALLMATVSWVLYRESWVGTAGDFAGVAAFAFFTDFTLEAALDLVGKVKKVTPG